MGRYNIELVTFSDCQNFVNAIRDTEGEIVLEDGKGFRVNARSLLGALAAMEWTNLYCASEEDIYSKIQSWVIN